MYNFRDPHFAPFAFSVTIIILELISSALSPNFYYSSFLQLNAYKPLFISVCFFLLGLAIYRFICSQSLHNFVRRKFPNYSRAAGYYGREILIVTEVIAAFLAYLTLSDFSNFTSWLVASSAKVQGGTSVCWQYLIITLICLRFCYNLLLGNYRTFVFWLATITAIFLFSLVGHREYFATNVFIYVYTLSYIFRYIATEENFYNFFARTHLSEARFAMLLHGATAIAELIASLMLVGIFVNSYADLNLLKSYF
ncbi:hypothetical protein [Psittacicella gerlachiana]|uniref:hypothetical protein n=1 Tax=Psittacicella gerlachiana TaxID=2028574 RepID=UPI0011C38D1F|nr:hypothetical protein [Psittacicella gerlachiana]